MRCRSRLRPLLDARAIQRSKNPKQCQSTALQSCHCGGFGVLWLDTALDIWVFGFGADPGCGRTSMLARSKDPRIQSSVNPQLFKVAIAVDLECCGLTQL